MPFLVLKNLMNVFEDTLSTVPKHSSDPLDHKDVGGTMSSEGDQGDTAAAMWVTTFLLAFMCGHSTKIKAPLAWNLILTFYTSKRILSEQVS